MLFLLLLIACCVGSLLAVITDRYPLMLYREWDHTPENPKWRNRLTSLPPVFNLFLPRSHCASCQHTLPWYHTIPLLSFLFLRGRCGFCQASIPKKTWHLEWLTALLCLIPILLLGWQPHAFALMLLYVALLTLTVIDIEHRLLPDTFTLSLLWLGLIGQLMPGLMPISPQEAITGAVMGYAFPWLISFVFEKIRRKTGLGLGDAKLLAALGAWGGPLCAIITLFIAAISCLLATLPLLIKGKISRTTLIPFGPFIAWAGALLITLQWMGYSPALWLLG